MDSPPAKSPHSYGGAPTSPLVLPNELIAEILSRLPVKTLMQLKCVCKSWKTLISNNPSFAKLHLQRSPRNTHLALVPVWSESDYQDMDCSVVPFPITRLLENPDSTIPNDPRYRLRNMDCGWIAGSCNGLICLLDFLFDSTYQMTWLRLWNPATNTLSKKLGYFRNRKSDFVRFAFGYDDLTDTYKVVAFSAANIVRVFSFGDDVWRNIERFPVVPFGVSASRLNCHPFVNHGVYLSNTINWLAIRNKTEYDEWNDITIEQFVIISLDLGTETYRELLPPQGFVEVPPVEPVVSVLMECLCFSHRFKGTHFVLWKMMEFGVQESWTQFLKISYQDLRIRYGISDRLGYNSQLFLFPLCVYESSNTLIMAINQESYDNQDHHAILYNWRDNSVEKTRFTNEMWWFYANDYVESLVSTS